MKRTTSATGFTLIEMLVVIALVATLAAMLFPVFASARERARQSSCASNLRQIGLAMAQYAPDYDGLYPYGADPLDKNVNFRGVDPTTDPVLKDIPYLQQTLAPYTKAPAVWRCPDDTGFDVLEEWGNSTTGEAVMLPAHPSAYAAFGTSYIYNTEFAIQHKLFAASGYNGRNEEVSPTDIAILSDISGAWHGSSDADGGIGGYAYMTLLGDGHVKRLNGQQFADAFFVTPNPTP